MPVAPRPSHTAPFPASRRRRWLSLPWSPARCCCHCPPRPACRRSANAPARCSPWRCILWVTEAMPIAITALLALVLQPMLGPGAARRRLHELHQPGVLLRAGDVRASRRRSPTPGWTAASRAGCWPRPTDRPAARCCSSWSARRRSRRSSRTCRARRSSWPWRWACSTRWDWSPGSRSSPAAVMIGIPIASLIGGVGTPAGSSVNILGLELHREVRRRAGAVRALDGDRHADGRASWCRSPRKVILWCYPPERDAHRGHGLPRRAARRWAR